MFKAKSVDWSDGRSVAKKKKKKKKRPTQDGVPDDEMTIHKHQDLF